MRRPLGAPLLLVLLACASVSLGATGEGYRVAGIMAVGGDYLAFLALPDGSQVLVRRGSVVGDGKIVGFTAQSVRIAFPSGEVELRLDGSGAAGMARAASPPPSAAVAVRHYEPITTPRAATLEASAQTLRSLPGSGSTGGDAGRALAQRIAPVLELPPTSRVVTINESPVTTADAAIVVMADTLAVGNVARLDVETPSGPQRVYISPPRRGP
jgi:hypothetical protein